MWVVKERWWESERGEGAGMSWLHGAHPAPSRATSPWPPITATTQASSTQALLQHGTKLYLLDLGRLSADLFYQQVGLRGGTFGPARVVGSAA